MAKKTILVVDDEEGIRSSIKQILEKERYNVIDAVNGDDCLKKLAKQKVDLIFLDIMMPGITTKELLKKIKNNKIIFITGSGLSGEERKAIVSKNVVDFIEKPFSVKTIVEKAKKHTS